MTDTPTQTSEVTEQGPPAKPDSPRPDYLNALLQESKRTEQKIVEAFLAGDEFIDPLDDFVDPETGRVVWEPMGSGEGHAKGAPFDSESWLTEIRNQCRLLARKNEYAINGHENRISYIVGTGHKYAVTARKRGEVSDDDLQLVQDVIDDFTTENKWQQRQAEIILRKDRDGECFLRLFETKGKLTVRFVEPGQVSTPEDAPKLAHHSFGIITDPDDVESIEGYYVDGVPVEAVKIQHRKMNVDMNVKRGLCTFFPVLRLLRNIEAVGRNAAVVARIQSAIAMIRKHAQATETNIQTMLNKQADVQVTEPLNKRTVNYKRYGPGTILDTNQQTEYEFPSQSVRPEAFVAVKQDMLRGVASRLVMPEFMLTSDASNANYSSTLVAEGPCVKNFERLQATMVEEDLEILNRVLDLAVESAQISVELRAAVEIDVTVPRLATRTRKDEVDADLALVRDKCMSRPTCMLKNELDPDHEQDLMDADAEKADPFAGMARPTFPGQATGGDEDGDGDEGGGAGGNGEPGIDTEGYSDIDAEIARVEGERHRQKLVFEQRKRKRELQGVEE